MYFVVSNVEAAEKTVRVLDVDSGEWKDIVVSDLVSFIRDGVLPVENAIVLNGELCMLNGDLSRYGRVTYLDGGKVKIEPIAVVVGLLYEGDELKGYRIANSDGTLYTYTIEGVQDLFSKYPIANAVAIENNGVYVLKQADKPYPKVDISGTSLVADKNEAQEEIDNTGASDTKVNLVKEVPDKVSTEEELSEALNDETPETQEETTETGYEAPEEADFEPEVEKSEEEASFEPDVNESVDETPKEDVDFEPKEAHNDETPENGVQDIEEAVEDSKVEETSADEISEEEASSESEEEATPEIANNGVTVEEDEPAIEEDGNSTDITDKAIDNASTENEGTLETDGNEWGIKLTDGTCYVGNKDIFEEAGIRGIDIVVSTVTRRGTAVNFDKIEEIVIPTGIKSVSSGVFLGCTNLKKLTFPNDMNSIGANAFQGCFQLESVKGSPVRICDAAFANCKRLSEFDFSRTKFIGNGAFMYSGSLGGAVSLPEIEGLGEQAFGHSKLSAVMIGKTIKGIGSLVFSSCDHLEEVVFQDKGKFEVIARKGYTSFEQWLQNKKEELRTISCAGLFFRCDHLDMINLSEEMMSEFSTFLFKESGIH